ncbi:MAG TPA: hypothetical protein VEC12_14285, partial [Bacteroidia bacterium]|nr:hypothetical protein [Bacteroidia bacterium]
HKPSQNCDTAFYYTSDSCYDSLILQIKIDTVTETYISRCKQRKYKTFELTSGQTYMGFNFYDSLKLEFSNPVMDVDTTYIELFEDTLLKSNYRMEFDTQNPRQVYFVYPWQEDKKYSLKFKKYTFTDLFGQQNDSLSITISTAVAATLGSLSINVTAPKTGNFIVQLLDAKSEVVNQRVISSATPITYRNLQPGQYFVKVINDVNQNGVWDGANYFKKQQPEPVYITPKSIEVRANWDITDIMIDPGF